MRFREDPIRLLRAVRFAAELEFKIESNTLKTLTDMSSIIGFAAPERIREELMKILMVRKPSSGFNLMVSTGLLKYFLPEILEGRLKRQNDRHSYTILRHTMETLDKTKPVPLLRLSAPAPRHRQTTCEKKRWRAIGDFTAMKGRVPSWPRK